METFALATRLGEGLMARGYAITTAESCTGGLLSAAITDVPGSSAWFAQGLVSYSNEAKERLLGVSSAALVSHGAVSEAVVVAMAEGARRSSGAEAAIAISGVAGPGGGSPDKPVGTVWIAWSLVAVVRAERFLYPGDRLCVRMAATRSALDGMLRLLVGEPPNGNTR